MLTNKADAIWCGCAITQGRKERSLFIRPYAAFDESVLVRNDSKVANPADLKGLKVAAIAGSTNMAELKAWLGCLPIAFSGQSDNVFADMVNALSNSDVDAVVDTEPAFRALFRDPRYKLAFTINIANLWGGAMQKHQSRLRQAIDLALKHIIVAGSLADIWGSYIEGIAYPSHGLNK